MQKRNNPFNPIEEDTDEFLRLAMTYLENKGYEVYIGNSRYTYKNANQNDIVCIMGAGDIDNIFKLLTNKNNN